ncbi:hypothetical protein Poly30_15610 [Planctomycetes bacterium Poly30]|uniref:Aminoglycoside phosphotransferase domain-containing protein n=1 Tax=Saltatorellus ferox TaxID=2528018 RepID=A0A518EPN7_9BACT|nr:hypothetical protein Poly30_15610 [Planctomycetes bacterium Poly30]
MKHALPYGIDSWLPVLRGGAAPSVFLDAGDARTAARLAKAWAELPAGGRIVLQSVAAPGSKPVLGPLEGGLKSSGTVERFVVFPGTGGSFTLLPTVDGAALRGGMALLPGGRAGGRALWALLRVASPLGIAQRLGRPELAIWTKGPFDRESEDLAVLPVAGSIAVAAGVPGRNQKIIVRALDRRGNARAILKLGFSERTDDAVTREAHALKIVGETLEDRAPLLLAEGRRAGRTWLAQEVLEGKHAGDEFTPMHADLLSELSRETRDEELLTDMPFFQDTLRNLCRLDPAVDPDWHREYSSLCDALENSVDGFALPTCHAHGDFTPWNLLARRGRVRAFDWEYFSKRAPALYDVFHFHIQTGVLVKRHSGERIFDDLGALFRGPAADVVAATSLRREEILQLAALYVLHEGVSHELEERRNPSPFAQAGWLRHARRALCRRLVGLLTERRLPDWTELPPDHGRVAA